MAENMQHWTARPRPEAVPLEGRYVRLEKLEARHADQLYDAASVADADARFTWLPETPPQDRASFAAWVEKVAASPDPIFFAIIDKASGKVAGRQTLMRIDAANGAVEIGNIYWGPLIARKAAATSSIAIRPARCFGSSVRAVKVAGLAVPEYWIFWPFMAIQ